MDQTTKKKYNLAAANLEPEKLTAITTTESPLLIIAGPGSGKTLTLIERLSFLVAEKGVAPERIFTATFTEKAAHELLTRVSSRMIEIDCQVNLRDMYIGTLHSLFLRLLEEHREYTRLLRNYRILDGFNQAYLVYQHINQFQQIENIGQVLHQHTVWGKTLRLVELFNKLREEQVDIELLLAAHDPTIQALGNALELYNEFLAEGNCLDFPGIQTELMTVLDNEPDLLARIQGKLDYFMIDEYQDTNPIQEKILLKLAAGHNRICVVGDDDQSLYRFRGATVQNILSFPGRFPEGQCRLVKLERNYRSHPEIIRFYNNWMNQIPGAWQGAGGRSFRYPKNIIPAGAAYSTYPAVIKLSSAAGEEEWFAEVHAFLQNLLAEGKITDYNQVAFLFRSVTNTTVKRLAAYLEARDVPVYSPRSDQFFERAEIKLMIGALLTIFPFWTEAVKWNADARLAVWDYYTACCRCLQDCIAADRHKHRLLLQYCIMRARQYTPLKDDTPRTLSHLFYELLQFSLFAEILDLDLSAPAQEQRAAYNLAAFSSLLVKFEYLHRLDVFTPKNIEGQIRALLNNFLRFLYEGGLAEYEGFNEYAPAGNVPFMTIHQSKGLEFPVVCVGSLNLNPRKDYDALDEQLMREYYRRTAMEPLEEIKYFDFWRLFYTAFSRPQNLLVLTGFEHKGQGSTIPSKSFKQVYQPLQNWREVDLAQLPAAVAREVSLKEEYSFTADILMYENCPLQYKFFRALEFIPIRQGAAMFGTLVHHTIEDVHKAVLRGEEQRVTKEQVEAWFRMNYQCLSKSLRAYLDKRRFDLALEQVQGYVKRAQRDWSVLKDAEVNVSLVMEDYILTGKVDLIRGRDNTVEIVDFKSEKKPDINNPEERRRLEKYRRQLEIYARLVGERYQVDISRMKLYYTSELAGVPTISFDYNQASVKQAVTGFSRVVEKIEGNDFDMAQVEKTRRLCENCDMQFYCNQRV